MYVEKERQARAEAEKRFEMEWRDERIAQLTTDLLIYKGTGVILVLVAISAIFKL